MEIQICFHTAPQAEVGSNLAWQQKNGHGTTQAHTNTCRESPKYTGNHTRKTLRHTYYNTREQITNSGTQAPYWATSQAQLEAPGPPLLEVDHYLYYLVRQKPHALSRLVANEHTLPLSGPHNRCHPCHPSW